MTAELQAGAEARGPDGTDVLPAADEAAPRFFVTRPVGSGIMWMYRDTDGELGFTHVKRHATAFTEDDADIIADQFNKTVADCQAEVVGAGRAE